MDKVAADRTVKPEATPARDSLVTIRKDGMTSADVAGSPSAPVKSPDVS